MFLWLPSVPKNKTSLDELSNQNNMCQIVIFFFSPCFIFYNLISYNICKILISKILSFLDKVELELGVWWEVATIHFQNECSAYMWYRCCQWSYTVAAYCSFSWTSSKRGETKHHVELLIVIGDLIGFDSRKMF